MKPTIEKLIKDEIGDEIEDSVINPKII